MTAMFEPREEGSAARGGAWKARGAAAASWAASGAEATLVDPVGLRREDEIVPVETLDLVRPRLDHDLTPCHVKVRVMLLALGQIADRHREIERTPEIGEREHALDPEDSV